MRAEGLLRPGAAVLVGLSGGRDSVCLLDLAVRVAGPGAVRALHVDHGLRPQAAPAEERACAELCRRLGVSLEVHRLDPTGRRGNGPAWAREGRYAALHASAAAREADVAVGHTASDQVETVLARLAAAPGRRALLGMAPRTGRLVRPLLLADRAATAAWCRARGLSWIDDPSNEDERFTRARTRARVVPALRTLHPAAEANLLRTVDLLRAEAAVLDALVEEVLGDADAIEVARLAALPRALQALVARELVQRVVPPAPAVAPERVARLLEAAGRRGAGAVDVGGGVRLAVESGWVRALAGPPEGAPAPVRLPVPGEARYGAWTLRGRPVAPVARAGVLDLDALPGELLVRARRPGDRVAPLGMHGTRSLQDLLVDRRVPRHARAALPVVEAAGEIAWVPEVVTSRRYAIGPSTRRALALEARRIEAGAGGTEP